VRLGIAKDDGVTSFDLSDIGFTEPVVAVKIIGIDNKGGSPGFDLVSVRALEGAIGPPPITYSLTVNTNGSGTGVILTSPLGINCGNDCEESYMEGTTIKLAATPNFNSFISSWSIEECNGKNECEIVMDSDIAIGVTFNSGLNCGSGIECDINGDGKLGLEEAIQALQTVSGLRD
jgi:hypothetical protein